MHRMCDFEFPLLKALTLTPGQDPVEDEYQCPPFRSARGRGGRDVFLLHVERPITHASPPANSPEDQGFLSGPWNLTMRHGLNFVVLLGRWSQNEGVRCTVFPFTRMPCSFFFCVERSSTCYIYCISSNHAPTRSNPVFVAHFFKGFLLRLVCRVPIDRHDT
jgi:hypothetical protein